MLNTKLTRCNVCAEIPNLLASIDAKVAEQAMKMYQNMIFMLNKPLDSCLIEDLLHYKRILTFKYLNEDYAKCYTLEQVANKVRSKTLGVNSNCDCEVNMFTTTTTSSTTSSTTTTTTTTEAPLNLLEAVISSTFTSSEEPPSWACSENTDVDIWINTTQAYDAFVNNGFVDPGDTVYTDGLGENTFTGGDNYRAMYVVSTGTFYTVMINSSGIIVYIELCGG